MKLDDDEETGARLEMTPIMDVVFLLLVFFIYAFLSMTVQHGMKVDLPKAEGSTDHSRNLQLVLTADDTLLLDGRTKISQTAAVEAIAFRQKTMEMPVVIRADRKSHTGVALELMAALRKAGVEKVTYQVEKEK